MGIKLEGFLCDSCRIFRTFEGVKANHTTLTDMEVDKNVLPNLSYAKLDGWEYYNYISDPNDLCYYDWIMIDEGFKCYCPKCARILKLKKVISKIKRHD